MSSLIYNFYKWIEKPLKALAFALRSNKSEYPDMNGSICYIGDTIIHHRHDPSQRGDICKYDYEFKLVHDSWGVVVGDRLAPHYLSHLIERKK